MKAHILLLSSIVYLLIPAPIRAQQAGLTITPPVIEVLLAPNKKIVQNFTIGNKGEAGEFVATLHAVKPLGEDGHTEIDPHPLDVSTIPVIVTAQNPTFAFGKPFTIKSGDTFDITMGIEGSSVDVSVDTYLALVISSERESNQSLGTSAGISSLILTTVSPDGILPINLSVNNFDLPLLHDSASSLSIDATVENKGATQIRTQGKMTVISPRGTEHTVLLYPHLILKESSRRILGSAGDPPIAQPLTWQPNLTAIGPYRIRLTLTTQGGTTIQELERTVWVLPVKYAISAVSLLIGVAALYLYKMKIVKRLIPLDTTTTNN